MTVLQAITVVGGYDIQRFRMQNPILEAADLKSEIEVQQSNVAKDVILIQRLNAELNGSQDFMTKPVDMNVAPDLLQQIIRDENQKFTEGRNDLQREVTHLRQLAGQADAKVKLLNERLRQEQKGAQADEEDAERLRSLVQRGVSSMDRQETSRRFSFLSSAKVLQTNVELEETRKEKAEYERKIDQVIAKYRMELLKERGEATRRLASAKARLASATEKAFYTSSLKSQLMSQSQERPDISIVRQTQNGSMRILAEEGTRLQPGDVVEIALRVGPRRIDQNQSPRASYQDHP